jgi:hypothetical protein
VATRKICETELQAVQARLKSATEELADKEIHLAQERRRSLQLEIAERDIWGFMNDLQSKLQTVKQNDKASIQKIVTLDQLVLYTVVLSSILLSYVRYRINDGRLFQMEFVKMRFVCWSLECLHIRILCDLNSVSKKIPNW